MDITFTRLSDVSRQLLFAHMSDPRIARHMPLINFEWDMAAIDHLVAQKEERWHKDGLGHWAILCDGSYVGWGGFEKEEGDWDYGLVLTPSAFGLGLPITRQALHFARADERISCVTFLLPPSRRHLRALQRIGAHFVGEVVHEGSNFLKFSLDTA
ncbi:MAG: GNAT family protein [Rhizobiaceae bacterium]